MPLVLVNGSTQTVTVSTEPPGAACTLDCMGTRIGAVSPTPGSVRIDKSKNDLSVTCIKDGYQTVTNTHSSKFSGATFGNTLLGGGVGLIVDISTGANFAYPEDIRMAMESSGPPSIRPIVLQKPGVSEIEPAAFTPEPGVPKEPKI